MTRIIKIIVVWLIRYLPGYHLHRDPRKAKTS
jgi:hypothetical protein